MSTKSNAIQGGGAPLPVNAPRAGADAGQPAPVLFQRLDTCHQEIERRLERLRALSVALAHDRLTRTARAEARMALNWFSENARQHHLDEEANVFPTLLACGDAALIERTQRLVQDHGWLEADWQQIAPSLLSAANGQNWFEPVVLRHAVEVFVQLYRDHMVREETLAYPEARQRLVPDLLRKQPLTPASASDVAPA